MRATVALSTDERRSLKTLGESVRLARLRRNLSQVELAERMGVSRLTIMALEKGSSSVSIGALVKALTVMGYTERPGQLLANDPIGDSMDLNEGRRRAGARANVADF